MKNIKVTLKNKNLIETSIKRFALNNNINEYPCFFEISRWSDEAATKMKNVGLDGVMAKYTRIIPLHFSYKGKHNKFVYVELIYKNDAWYVHKITSGVSKHINNPLYEKYVAQISVSKMARSKYDTTQDYFKI